MKRKENVKKTVKYKAIALEDHVSCYGELVVKKGDKCFLKKLDLEKYHETGKVYFNVTDPWGYFSHYFIKAKVIKITTKVTTITETEESEEVC